MSLLVSYDGQDFEVRSGDFINTVHIVRNQNKCNYLNWIVKELTDRLFNCAVREPNKHKKISVDRSFSSKIVSPDEVMEAVKKRFSQEKLVIEFSVFPIDSNRSQGNDYAISLEVEPF